MVEIVLLGPQIHRPNVRQAVAQATPEGPVAVVTCGWQEAEEEEAAELGEMIGRPLIKLLLHKRSDDIFQTDPEFFDAYRQRQYELHQLQDFYRLRLSSTLKAARELMRREGAPHLIEPEREATVEAVRTLDHHHLERLREVHERFEAKWRPGERDIIARHRREVAQQLKEATAVVVAGGHVAVLLYRLRLLDLAPMFADRPVVAWSAGAMALAESVVLFHDHPPQGEGDPEVLESGLGLVRGILPFPDASRRLNLDDPVRVSLLARRFAPCACVAMDEGVELHHRGEFWSARGGTRRLSPSGALVEWTQ